MIEHAYKHIEERLLCAIENGFVFHAIFISCPDESIAERLARVTASKICGISQEKLSQTPDCIMADGGSLKIDDIRTLIVDELAKRSFSAGARCVLIQKAHGMSEACQNALLKTLEEAPPLTSFILTGNEAGLLPTIRSRCIVVRVGLMDENEIAAELKNEGVPQDTANFAASVSQGLYSEAVQLATNEFHAELRRRASRLFMGMLDGDLSALALYELKSQAEAGAGIEFMLSICVDMLKMKTGAADPVNNDMREEILRHSECFNTEQLTRIFAFLLEAKRRITCNISPGLTMDRLFACISQVRDDYTHEKSKEHL